ncbi:dTDP-glucose 4,6-dehydratase [Prochlorococcus marinus str. MIT 1313]|uniref:SDR family NAD(P)-dependent oxidoreductase n=1 Tax=Prochlorococcus TaxID=1218 RepID=UPI0007BB2554|nr:SDR family NAD(P)-dependent oxidoreductase [Prochlorococcus marinus]KZR69972.1 dTDP-glucose 4,6-dehydratase [Prochlorococcus marinus str. MIT 1313]KZR72320.1 dTDP-glucose 4,6-dehydratase [Prochlorococcus marinus str. MIT 1318]
MKALVTGADGFIGSHLCQFLLNRKYDVKALCQYNSWSSSGWLDTISQDEYDSINIIHGDIRDAAQINNLLADVDIVYHLAALISIPYSYSSPISYVQTNTLGTINILNSCLQHNVERLIHTSTSECYGNSLYVPMDEEHPLNAQSPYAASKIAADQFCLSFHKSFNLPLTILRPFNTYGPRQSLRAVIPSIIMQAIQGKKTVSLGSLIPTRDFTHVFDTCDAFIKVCNSKTTIGHVINCASNFEVSIKEVVEIISRLLDTEIVVKTKQQRVRPEASEVYRLFGDNSKIKKLTDWEPKFLGKAGFINGLRETINWFYTNQNLSCYKSIGYTY